MSSRTKVRGLGRKTVHRNVEEKMFGKQMFWGPHGNFGRLHLIPSCLPHPGQVTMLFSVEAALLLEDVLQLNDFYEVGR